MNRVKSEYQKYIGMHVHAGGELNGIAGHIVNVEDEYDDVFEEWFTWFYVKDQDTGHITKYGKEDLQEITIGIVYIPLE